jgi:hypothetical protein
VRRAAAVAAIAIHLTGCTLDPICPTWSRAESGACTERAWTLPKAGDAMGDAWAQDVLVTIDGRGRGLVGYASTPGLEVLEESAPGVWSLHRAGGAVGGSLPTDLVAGADGSAVFVWSVISGSSQTQYMSERDASGAWQEPQSTADAFSFPPTGAQARLATNRGGEWLLTWDQWRAGAHFAVAVADRAGPGAPWKWPANADDVLSMPVFFSNAPVVALNDAGQALITWYQSLGGPLRAFVSERGGPGEPFVKATTESVLSADGAPVDSDPVAAVKPAIAADGSAAAAWAQENGKGATIVYLATRDAAGTWTKPSGLDDAFSLPSGYARGVQIAFGPGGDLYVVWYQDAGDGDAVYAARRRPDGTWAEDGRHPIRLSSAGATGLFPRIAIGPAGGVVVVWDEHVAGGPRRIAARRTGPAREPWGPVEILSPATGEDAVLPVVAVGPGDRAIAAWAQGPSAAQRVMVARIE